MSVFTGDCCVKLDTLCTEHYVGVLLVCVSVTRACQYCYLFVSR